MKRIYLIDCPGVVPPSNNDSPQDILLRGVVRVENVENPEQYIAAVLQKTKPQHIERTYDIRGFDNATGFLELLARKGGRLLKGGEADVDGVAKMVLNDFLRGKIPWFTPPPSDGERQEKGVEGRKGMLGEMGRIGVSKAEASTLDIGNAEGAEHPPAAEDLSVKGLQKEPEQDEIGDENGFDGFDEESDVSMDEDEEMSGVSDDLDDSDTQKLGGGSLVKPPIDVASPG